MSIILKALKKSEAQRRLGKTPTLAETAAISSVPDTAWRFNRWWLLMLLVLLLAAGWFVRDYFQARSFRQQAVVDARQQPVVESKPLAQSAVQSTDDDPVNGQGSIALDEIARLARAEFEQTPASGENEAKPVFTTPVELYSAPVSEPEIVAGAEGSGNAAEQQAPRADIASTASLAVRKVGTEPLSIYEIPRDIRSSLPVLKITLQVYDDEPENRFAVVNGGRLVEGNELEPGLVLVEIRKRGLVFSYRDYRFIVGE